MESDNEYRLIPIIYARVISHAAGRTPREVREVLRGTGIEAQLGEPPSRGMTLKQYRCLLKNAMAIADDTAITLRAGVDLPLTTHGDLGIATATAPTIRAALEVFASFTQVRNPYGGIGVIEQGNYVAVEVQMETVLGEQRQAAVDLVFAAFSAGFLPIFAPVLTHMTLTFSRSRPANSELYSQLLQLPIRWGAQRDAIVLPKAELDIPLKGANPEEFEKALTRLRTHYSMMVKPATYSEAVISVFTQQSGRLCTIATVASALHISARTLNRKLKLEKTSFQRLLDKWLAQQSLNYLRDGQLTIEATAALMGYGDEANLRRAFKRWFGMPVSHYLKLPAGTPDTS